MESSQRLVQFACLQPLHLSTEPWIQLLARINRVMGTEEEAPSGWRDLSPGIETGDPVESAWLRDLVQDTQGQFFHIRLAELTQAPAALEADLNALAERHPVLKHCKLAPEHAGVQLMMLNNSVAMLVFRLGLHCPDGPMSPDTLAALPLAARALMERDREGSWHRTMLHQARVCLRDLFNRHLGIEVRARDITEPANTGHLYMDYGSRVFDGEAEALRRVHQLEEAEGDIASDSLELTGQHPGAFVHFGWSYSSVYGLPREKASRCLPFMLNLQGIWFLNRFFKECLLGSMIRLSGDMQSGELRRQSRLFDTLVMAFEISTIRHSQYKAALKPWQTDAFEWVEGYWQLNQAVADLRHWVLTNKEFVERKISYSIQSIEQRQSFILFVITLIQMLTIVGFFKDYFDLLSYDKVPSQLAFLSEERLNNFNFYLPIGLISLNLCFLGYIYRQAFADRLAHSGRRLQRYLTSIFG